MNNLDDLLVQLNEKPQETKVVVVKEESKKQFPVSTVLLLVVIGVMGYFIFIKKDNTPGPGPEPIPVVQIADKVAELENLYSTNKGKAYERLAQLVEEGQITNQSQLQVNAQAILEEARKTSLYKLDELDNEMLPKDDWKDGDKRNQAVMYLIEKSKGFIKAGK